MDPGSSSCNRRTATLLFLVSAIPLSLLISTLTSTTTTNGSYVYTGRGWFRECTKWDPLGHRFLASTFSDGSIVEIAVKDGGGGDFPLEERTVIRDADVAGTGSVGIVVDRVRNRIVVVYGDLLWGRLAAVGAYQLDSWDRIFLTWLSGPDDEPSFADDVAVDLDGNAYITDAKSNKIWKVGMNGEFLSVIKSNAFIQRKEWYHNFVGLNGILYHPNGYLLVIHTAGGYLLKVDTVTEEVSIVRVKGSLFMGDGMELLSPTKIAVAGSISSRLIESSDDWETATVTGRYIGPLHRIATSATVMDGKVYLNHILGGGLKKRTHVIAEAVFTPVNVK